MSGETFTPPSGVQSAAKRALEWIKDGQAGSGFTNVGRRRASDLANAHGISEKTLRRMKAYFDRHQPDQKAEGFKSGENGFPSPGRVAWDAWGGDAGYSWAKKMVAHFNSQDEVKKGDVAGHPFHGNQYENGESGKAFARSKDFILNNVFTTRSIEGSEWSNHTINSEEKENYTENLSKIISNPEGFKKALAEFPTNGKPDPAKAVMAMLGNLGKPSVVSESEFSKGDEYQRLFTGLSAPVGKGAEVVAGFAHSDNPTYGGGIYGTAFYTSELPSEAVEYANERGDARDHMLLQMRLDWSNPDASNAGSGRSVNYNFSKEANFNDLLKQNGFDKGTADLLAEGLNETSSDALSGYKYTNSGYVMVYDRSILQMSDTYASWGETAPTSTGDQIFANQKVNTDTGVSAEPINRALAKGDVAGHEFHGNQWEVGDGQAKELANLYFGVFRYAPEGLEYLGSPSKEDLVRKSAFAYELNKRMGGETLSAGDKVKWKDLNGTYVEPIPLSHAQVQQAKQDANNFMKAVSERSAPVANEVERGLVLDKLSGAKDAFMEKFAEGKTVDLPLSSWANQQGTGFGENADQWANRYGRNPNEAVYLHAPAGTIGTQLSALDPEHIGTQLLTGGRFVVDRVDFRGDGTHIYLTQKQFYAKSKDWKTADPNYLPKWFPSDFNVSNDFNNAFNQAKIPYEVGVEKGDVEGHVFHGNQWTGGEGSYSSPEDGSPESVKNWAGKISDQLKSGETPNIHEADVPNLLQGMQELDNGQPDISKLRVDGKEMFGGDGKGYLRSDMPQIPPSKRDGFLDYLRNEKGVSVEKENVDPRDLKTIQGQISGTQAGWMYHTYKEAGIPQTKPILISKDNYIIDGNHTWAGAVGIKIANPSLDLPVYRIGLNWNDALSSASDYAQKMGYASESHGEVNKKSSSTDSKSARRAIKITKALEAQEKLDQSVSPELIKTFSRLQFAEFANNLEERVSSFGLGEDGSTPQ